MSSIPDSVKLPFVFEGMWFFKDFLEMFDLFARMLSYTPSYLYDFFLPGRLVRVQVQVFISAQLPTSFKARFCTWCP